MSGVIAAMKTTMYTDVPRFTRCCFCFPLRYSLLVWGCIMLVFNSFSLFFAINTIHAQYSSSFIEVSDFVYLSICGCVGDSVDILACIILILAALKKHEKLFRVSYYFGIALFIYMSLYNIYSMVVYIHISTDVMPASTAFIYRHILRNTLISAGGLLLQAYVILLIRTEMTKLRDQSKVQFTNNAVDGQIIVETIQQDGTY